MSLSKFNFYQDPGLTNIITEPLEFIHNNDGSTPQIDRVVYLGSPLGSAYLETKQNPGFDQITLSIDDAVIAAGTPKSLDLKLSSSFIGLDTAVAGDPLLAGVKIDGGVPNALSIYIRATVPDGLGLDLSITSNELAEIY